MLRINVWSAVALVLVLLVAPAPSAAAHGSESREYVTSLGVGVGGSGSSINALAFGPGEFTSAHGHNRVSVAVADASGSAPYIVVCADLNANGVCAQGEGDLAFNGYGRVTMFSWAPVSRVVVSVYALQVEDDGTAHVGTTGSVTVTWW